MGQVEVEATPAPETPRVTAFRGFSGGGADADGFGEVASAVGAERPRRRIVRPSQAEPEEPPSPTTLPRLSRSSPVGSVRVVAPPDETPAAADDEAEAPPNPRRQPLRRRTARAVPPAAPSDLYPASDASDFDLPPEADTFSLSTVQPPPPASFEEASGTYAWQVEVPGHRKPLLVVADDIAEALQIASEHLGAEVVAEARAWRVGPVLRDED